jgi:4-hydroxy-3-methylbut-2-enyl diphosphate reductase
MHITLSKNISYCFGVKRTLTLVEELLRHNPDKTYYMLGEIVHNEYVINDLKAKGLRIVQDLDSIESGASVIIQSHGAPRMLVENLERKGLDVIDATCPMVTVIHEKIVRLVRDGYFPVIIGKKGHDEVRGIAGQVDRALIVRSAAEITPGMFGRGIERVGVVVQSTFIRTEAVAIVKKIEEIVEEVKFIDTICRPTTVRQEEVENIPGDFDYILIIGSQTSANTRHLFKLASGREARVYLVDDPETVRELNIRPGSHVFVASGASTPLHLIERVVALLESERSLGTERGGPDG